MLTRLAPEIAVLVVVGFVIVSHLPPVPVPVTLKELTSIMMRCDPASGRVRRSSPVTLMPLVFVSHRIPITVDPNVVGARTAGHDSNDAGRRGRTNSDSHRDLSTVYRHASQ